MIRFAVFWRKRFQDTKSEKDNRWVECILTLRQTCRLQGKSIYGIMVDAMEYYFKDQKSDLQWIRRLPKQPCDHLPKKGHLKGYPFL